MANPVQQVSNGYLQMNISLKTVANEEQPKSALDKCKLLEMKRLGKSSFGGVSEEDSKLYF